MRKLVADVVEPDISVEIPTVQQEVNSFIDVGWKDIFKSSVGQSRKVEKSKNKSKATGTPREDPTNRNRLLVSSVGRAPVY